jgi:glycosyltransferase involved in cell wall biosynthesis
MPRSLFPMQPKVSVVTPVYNRFDRLKHVVDSVLAQTLPVTEIILVDDGSVDDTPELLPRYIRDTLAWRERVRYIRQENQGPNIARNTGIAHVTGEWLAFNDNDDLWLPQKLEWQFRALEQFPQCGACISDAWFMNNSKMKMTLFQLAGKEHKDDFGVITEPLNYLLQTKSPVGVHPVWLQNLVVRTELARRLKGFDPRLRIGEDDDFVFRLACQTTFCFVNMPMVLIDRTPPETRHEGASSNWDNRDFRLHMAQMRYEKRLQMEPQLPLEVQKIVKRDLAAVHSGWANWFLEKRDYKRAREAAARAAGIHLSAGILMKWLLTTFTPGLATKMASSRQEQRSRRMAGIG